MPDARLQPLPEPRAGRVACCTPMCVSDRTPPPTSAPSSRRTAPAGACCLAAVAPRLPEAPPAVAAAARPRLPTPPAPIAPASAPSPPPPASARRRPRNAAPAIRRRAATTYSPAPRRCCCSCPPPSPASTTAPRPARRPPHCRGPTRARRPDACAPRLLSSPVTLPCPSRPWPGRGPSCPGLTLRELLQKSAGPRPTRGPSPYHRRGAYARRLGAPRPARDSRVVWSCLLFSVALVLSARPLPRLPPARAFFESTFRSIVLCALAAGAHGPTRCSARCDARAVREGRRARPRRATTASRSHARPRRSNPHTWLAAEGMRQTEALRR